MSYAEVRRFETSVTKEQLKNSHDVYIPDGIKTPYKENGTSPIHAAIENFDQYENTIYGTGTTHALVTVLYQENSGDKKESSKEKHYRQMSMGVEDLQMYQVQSMKKYIKPVNLSKPQAIPGRSIIIKEQPSKSLQEADV